VNGGLWGGQDHLGDFPFRFAQELQMALDFFQRIHITRVTHGFIPADFQAATWNPSDMSISIKGEINAGLMKIYYVPVTVGSLDRGYADFFHQNMTCV
jgi:hypothetical protein